MSNLLNESIVDAKALRESALKNAESVVIEKYADEVKKTLESLLEQEEDLGIDTQPTEPTEEAPPSNGEEVVQDQSDDVPLAATDGLGDNEGANLDSLQSEGEGVEVTLDLGALQEAIEALSNELDEEVDLTIEEEEELEEGEIPAGLKKYMDSKKSKKPDGEETDEEEDKKTSGDSKKMPMDDEPEGKDLNKDGKKGHGKVPAFLKEDDLEEDIDMGSLFDSVMEKLSVDMGFDLSGWAGRPTSQIMDEKERELAQEASTDSEEQETFEEEQEELNESNEELKKALDSNENLKEELVKYESAMEQLKENLYEVNLSNARLLYTNRVLRNSSLNERQKDKIVEAISGAGSVAEAKTIYETLQSTVEAKPKRSPQSLSEAISNRSSVLTASRKETKATSQDPFSDRMRRLAGIK